MDGKYKKEFALMQSVFAMKQHNCDLNAKVPENSFDIFNKLFKTIIFKFFALILIIYKQSSRFCL